MRLSRDWKERFFALFPLRQAWLSRFGNDSLAPSVRAHVKNDKPLKLSESERGINKLRTNFRSRERFALPYEQASSTR